MAPKSLIFLLAIAACVDAADTGTEAAAIYNDDGCPRLGCSSNSPYLGPIEFHELHEHGTIANAEGLRITSFKSGPFSYRANVTGTTLVAQTYNAVLGRWMTARSGQQLVGMVFTISSPRGVTYEVTITRVSNSQQYWQAPITTLETYELKWRIAGRAMHYINVCTNPPDPKDPEGGAMWSSSTSEAILFTGDRYNTEELSVTATDPASAGDWFNIGCFGNVMAKLVLNRHTHASQLATSPTTWAQRQTMLKMYTSDVCGHGRAFTVQGTPIQWFAANGWSSPGVFPDHEGLWNEHGAVCLDTHRLQGTANDATAEIAAECALHMKEVPPCASYDLSLAGPYLHTKTAVPLP
jgi:hypothetical protein